MPGRWTMGLILLCAGLCGAGGAKAGASARVDRAEPPARSEGAERAARQTAFAADLLAELRLDRAQLARLLPIFDEACARRVEFESELDAALMDALETYPAYRNEKMLDRGITPAVEERAVAAHSRLKELQLDFDAAQADLEARLLNTVLTGAQRRTAQRYEPDRERIREELGEGKRSGHPRAARGKGVPVPAPQDRAGERLEVLKEELREIEAFSHPRAGVVGKLLLSPACAEIYYREASRPMPTVVRQAMRLEQPSAPGAAGRSVEADFKRVIGLKNEINDWNLLNGLKLTLQQNAFVRQAALTAESIRREHAANRLPQAWLDAELARLERAVRSALQPGQRKVLDEFNTCFKGKPSLRDPVRIGQANDETSIEAWLQRARTLDEDALIRAIEHRVDSEEKRLLGPLSPTERNARTAALRSATRQAQALDDVDFALNLSALAKSAAVSSRASQINREMDRIHAEQGEPNKITRLMFNAAFVRALDIRAAQLRDPRLARARIAGEGPRAENCDRSCALPPGAATKPSKPSGAGVSKP